MKLKKFATAALALAAIGMGAPTQHADILETSNSRQVNQPVQKNGIVQAVKSARQIIREDAGGLQVLSYKPGIPPHIYGANYVRRGTHKRTNKV